MRCAKLQILQLGHVGCYAGQIRQLLVDPAPPYFAEVFDDSPLPVERISCCLDSRQ